MKRRSKGILASVIQLFSRRVRSHHLEPDTRRFRAPRREVQLEFEWRK